MSDNQNSESQTPIGPDAGEESGEIAVLSQRAYQLLREDRVAEAEELFTQILETDPSNCYALVGLGDAARKRHDFEGAVAYYERCLSEDSVNNYALFGLADSYKSMRRYHQAIEIWERYLEKDDGNVTVLTRVADAYRKVREHDKSQDVYSRVLEIESDNAYALIGLGHLHYDFREYGEALSYWRKMHDIAGDSVDIRVLTSIGNCYRKLKEFQKGIPYFESAQEQEPGNFYALFGLADCYRGLNQPDRSLTYWNQILDKDPTNKVILTRAGDAYRAMGEIERAESYYQKALNIEFDIYAIIGLAVINRKRGQYEEAIKDLSSLLEREPKNHRIYIELAQTHLQAGDPEIALETLQTFKSLGIHNSYVLELMARIERDR